MGDELDLLQRHRALVALSSFSHRCTLHFSGEEFECLEAYGRLHLWIGSWVYCAIFQTHEWKWFTFPRTEVLPVHLALFHLMCLHDMLCGSLGVIKFDIKLVILYFFQNLLILLILKWLAYYSELPLI